MTPFTHETADPDTNSVRVLQLIDEFKALLQQMDGQDNAAIEERKLCIIQTFEALIQKKLPEKYSIKSHLPTTQYTLFHQISRNTLYYFLLFFGLFEDTAGSYLFGSSLFAMLPSISNPALIIASVIFTLVSGILFYAFEVTFLKDALGIPHTSTELSKTIEIHFKQLKATTNINQMLSNIHIQTVDSSTYQDYLCFIKLLNQDLRSQHEKMKYPDSFLKSVLKIIVIAFGAVSHIAGSCFMAKSLLTLLAPSILGTPIGWLIMGLTVIAGLGFYYSMDATSMIRLVNPSFDQFHNLKNELRLFIDSHHDDLSQEQSVKERFIEKKPTREMSTQTTPKLSKHAVVDKPSSTISFWDRQNKKDYGHFNKKSSTPCRNNLQKHHWR